LVVLLVEIGFSVIVYFAALCLELRVSLWLARQVLLQLEILSPSL
jgi:hypothetical protein